MKVLVKQEGFAAVMDEDGEFRCPHDDVDVEYDPGGPGYLDPPGGYSVHCNDCDDEDLHQNDVDNIIDSYESNMEDSMEREEDE